MLFLATTIQPRALIANKLHKTLTKTNAGRSTNKTLSCIVMYTNPRALSIMDTSAPSPTFSSFSVIVTTNTKGDCSAAVTQYVAIEDDVPVNNVVAEVMRSFEILPSFVIVRFRVCDMIVVVFTCFVQSVMQTTS